MNPTRDHCDRAVRRIECSLHELAHLDYDHPSIPALTEARLDLLAALDHLNQLLGVCAITVCADPTSQDAKKTSANLLTGGPHHASGSGIPPQPPTR